MQLIQSLDDLKAARAQAVENKRQNTIEHPIQILIGMSTCGIAAGAMAAWDIFEHFAADPDHNDPLKGSIHLAQIGCIGLCALEPIVQVQMRDQPPVTYGKVTPEAALRILDEHIGKGIVVIAYQIENV